MRIKVVTSINVRSSPFASPRAVIQEAFPEPQERGDLGEKSSPMPSLAPGQYPRMDRLIASQRIPHGSRLSGWLHGSSVRTKDRREPPNFTRKTSHTSTSCFAAAERRQHATGIRSYPSTRGLIDPVHSPSCGPRQLTHGPDPRRDAYLERLRAELSSQPRERCSKRHHQQRLKRAPAKKGRLCFPQIKDLKIRQKIIGCLFFGTLLTIILTTCNSLRLAPYMLPYANHLLMAYRSRPRNIRILPRRHFPWRFHLLHPRPYHLILPLPDPSLHARLRTQNAFRPQTSVTA